MTVIHEFCFYDNTMFGSSFYRCSQIRIYPLSLRCPPPEPSKSPGFGKFWALCSLSPGPFPSRAILGGFLRCLSLYFLVCGMGTVPTGQLSIRKLIGSPVATGSPWARLTLTDAVTHAQRDLIRQAEPRRVTAQRRGSLSRGPNT